MGRFLFRGLDRESGKPVEGRVEACDTEAAYQVLSDHGIVTDSLRDDTRSLAVSPATSAISQFADALERALDSSSSQIAFDDLSERYRGKKIWVVDREKIRRRVAQVVDSTLAASDANLESGMTARQRVANVISGLFGDTRNIASEHNAEIIAKLSSMVGAATVPGAGGNPAKTDADLAQQIGRLSAVVEQAEGLIAAMSAALHAVESGGGPRRRVAVTAPSPAGEQNQVLREIFQSNLDLRRAIRSAAQGPAVEASGPN